MAREYFCAYHSFLEDMEQLGDAERGRLFTALLEYSKTGTAPELRGNERILFPAMRGKIDRDRKRYVSRGDYVVIGGRPSAGKTALTLQIAMNMARERNVIYFSLETKPDKLYHRLLSCYAGLSLTAIKQQRLTAADWQRVADESDFCKLKLQVISAAGWTVDQIQAAAMARGAEVVFIDYLGLVKGRGKDLYERVTNISMDLHTMAQRQNIAVIALSQLSRQGKDKADVTSLRDSGQIEQDADVILLLDNLDEDRRKLAVAKNKEGRLGSIDLHFDGDHQRFSEITDIDPPPVYRRNR